MFAAPANPREQGPRQKVRCTQVACCIDRPNFAPLAADHLADQLLEELREEGLEVHS